MRSEINLLKNRGKSRIEVFRTNSLNISNRGHKYDKFNQKEKRENTIIKLKLKKIQK